MPLPTRIIVADVPCNRQSAYWRDRIDCKGVILEKDPDGLWCVALDGAPVWHDGVNPDRFQVIQWSRWVRIRHWIMSKWPWRNQ